MGTANFAVEIVEIGVGFALGVDRGGGLTGSDRNFDQIVGLTQQGVGQWAPGCLFAPLTWTGQSLQQPPEDWLRKTQMVGGD